MKYVRQDSIARDVSRLYRSQILQVNNRWKALAEIYKMHSFAPFLESKFEKPGKKYRSLISNVSLKIAEKFPDFLQKFRT